MRLAQSAFAVVQRAFLAALIAVVTLTVALNPYQNDMFELVFPKMSTLSATALISVCLITLIIGLLGSIAIQGNNSSLGNLMVTFSILFQLVLAIAFFRNPTIAGLQQLISLEILLLGPFAISRVVLSKHRRVITSALTAATALSAAVFWFDFVFTILEKTSGFHRSTALVIALLSPYLAVAHRDKRALSVGLSLFLFATVLMTASRTATVAIMVGLTLATWLIFRRARETLISGVGMGTVTVLGYLTLPHLRERFFPGIESTGGTPDLYPRDPSGRAVITLEVITNPDYLENLTWGRLEAWRKLVEQLESPGDWIWGKGLGSASDWGRENLTSFDTPLNEYLRFMFDIGAVGMITLLSLCAILLSQLMRLKPARERLLALVVPAVILSSTESTLIYIFSVAPIALILGSEMSLLPIKRAAKWQ